MSEYTYTKSIATDFGGNFRSDNLVSEINAQSFTPNLLRVDRTGDVVNMVFDASLSGGEETILNNTVIPNHSAVVPVFYKGTINNVLRNNQINSSTYKRVSSFIYEGSNTIYTISKILSVGYMDSGVTSYSILIEDITHNNVISENTFTNTTEQILALTPINNIPTTQSKIEISVKKIGGNNSKYANVESVTFYLA